VARILKTVQFMPHSKSSWGEVALPRFLNCPVEGQIEWPRSQAEFLFGDYEIVFFPDSKEQDASMHIDLARHKLSSDMAMSIFCQILSIATWLDNTFAALLPGWSTSPAPF
jgi:hypothetical protein